MPSDRLGRCFMLAMLLHVLLVLVLGNTPGGTARPGEGVWGSLSVRLQGEPSDTRPGQPVPPAPDLMPPQPEPGPLGRAKRPDSGQRYGGVVRVAPAADQPVGRQQPGAARLGQWRERSAERLDGDTVLGVPPALPEPTAVPPPPSLPRLAPPGTTAAPALDKLPSLPRLPAPVPTPLERLPTAAPLEPAAIAPEPPMRRSPRSPAPLPAALERLAAPAPPTLDTAGRLNQDLPTLAPLETQELPTPTAVARQPAAPLPTAPNTPALLDQPALDAAPDAPRLRVRPGVAESLDKLAPSAERAESLPNLPKLDAPAMADKPVTQLPAAAAERVATPSTTLPTTPSALPVVPAPPLIGAPDAGSRLGHDIATPPSAAASAPQPKLNLSLPRGGEISSQGGRGLLQMLPHPPERKSRLSEGIENAARKDCREAHSDKGLVGVVPLLLDGARDKGCRW